MPGRKRIPDHIKVMRGTAEKRNTNPDQPKYDADEIQCPAHFSDEHKAVWFDIVPQLVRAGCAKNIDALALEVLCEKWVEYRKAQDYLNENGGIIVSPNGYPQLSPQYSMAKQALADFGKIMTEFGMTPASRSKITTKDSEKPKNDRFSNL